MLAGALEITDYTGSMQDPHHQNDTHNCDDNCRKLGSSSDAELLRQQLIKFKNILN